MTTPVMPPFATADATYPAIVRTEQTKRDFIDPIWAAHFNLIQNEVQATQTTLGVWPQIATADPAGRRPNYGTVAERVNKTARAEQMISYVAANTTVQIPGNAWYRPNFDNPADSHGAAETTGLRIPQTGYWVISVKADWTSTETTLDKGALRVVSLEIDEKDVGLRRALKEDQYTASTPTTHFIWQEALAEGTDISVSLCTFLPGGTSGGGGPSVPPGCPGGFPIPPSHCSDYPLPLDFSDRFEHTLAGDDDEPTYQVNVYLRAHLVRCLSQAALDLTTNFKEIPKPPPPEKPPPPTPEPQPKPRPTPGRVTQPEEPWSNGYDPEVKIVFVNYDTTVYSPDVQGGYYSEAAWIDYSTNFYADAAADTRYY